MNFQLLSLKINSLFNEKEDFEEVSGQTNIDHSSQIFTQILNSLKQRRTFSVLIFIKRSQGRFSPVFQLLCYRNTNQIKKKKKTKLFQ